MNNLFVFNHPVITHKISLLKDITTDSRDFRALVREITMLMGYEVTKGLLLHGVTINTHFGPTTTQMVSGKSPCIVAVWRAGDSMLQGMLDILPTASAGHIGVYRDHGTCLPVPYYCKLPEDVSERMVIVCDPMLATGGSSSHAVKLVKDKGVTNIKFMCLFGATEGIEKMTTDHPDVQVFCAEAGYELNEKKYLIFGPGDAGDRIFGTK